MTPAARLGAYLRRRVKATGGDSRKLAWTCRRGAPDVFVWWPGPIQAFIEIKAGEDRLTRIQEYEHKLLRAAGFRVFTVKTFEDIDAVIGELTHLKGCDSKDPDH